MGNIMAVLSQGLGSGVFNEENIPGATKTEGSFVVPVEDLKSTEIEKKDDKKSYKKWIIGGASILALSVIIGIIVKNRKK